MKSVADDVFHVSIYQRGIENCFVNLTKSQTDKTYPKLLSFRKS